MKRCILLTLTAMGIITTLMAQTQASSSPQKLIDPAMVTSLQKDLNFRNSDLRNSQVEDQPVNWYDSGYGYTGIYSLNGDNWMVCYDKEGEYMETFKKDDWNNPSLPSELKTAYGQSLFKDHRVTSFWVVSDPQRKGYYMETLNNKGKTMSVWVDQNGDFITMPPKNPYKVSQKE